MYSIGRKKIYQGSVSLLKVLLLVANPAQATISRLQQNSRKCFAYSLRYFCLPAPSIFSLILNTSRRTPPASIKKTD